ncbi:MAG: hypothetical protein UR81_C0012G0009 [Candidatus Levybacteria bacterium GW2011_GWB1_35_5]|nr:MAG: hypothetical protein UR81_C0012G0009 [Candidatus Levybacteria bacterium GW2011_GWB1_35_5]
MNTKISVFGKDYECYVVEQTGRAKETRYKTYGTFEGRFLEAQESSISGALKRLKQKAEIALNYFSFIPIKLFSIFPS